MTKVKICGLRRAEDAAAAARYRADYAGCILAKGFRRTITIETAREIRAALSDTIPLVGVFVNDAPEEILAYLKDGIIDIAQLHGQESAEEIRWLQEKSGRPIWKVFQMNGEVDAEAIEHCPADLVLLDAGTGSGERFDWAKVRAVHRPFILAGGLTPANVAKAIAQTQPYAVDTSSGVETDGVKDIEKIAAFLKAAGR